VTAAAPTWGEVEQFLGIDGWRQLPARERGGSRQPHIFFEKVLADRRVLQTHISHDGGARMSPGRFSSILRHQLEVSRTEFWNALETGAPVERPVDLDEDAAVELPAWAVRVLTGDLHLSVQEIAGLSPDEAVRLVHEHWAQPG
jgi:hypothetical protein